VEPFQISKKTIVVLALSLVVGIILYNAAPTDIQPGEYQATLIVEAPSISVRQTFTVTMAEVVTSHQESYLVIGTSTNLTVVVSTIVPIAPESKMHFEIIAEGDEIQADQCIIIVEGDHGFNVTLRPTHQSGQTIVVDFQPLVKSQWAIVILGVVAILWFSEGISLVATSLLIPVTIILTEIASPRFALAPFFDPAVALILGGFMIGRALSKYELDKRLALLILSRSTGSGSGLLLTVMGVTAFLSMWISNTASAAIMIPIALAVISRIRSQEIRSKYGKVLVLGVAYSATIGGVASLVGSPPNPLAATYINSFLGIEISFIDWIPFGFPVVLIMLPLIWQWLMIRFRLPSHIEEISELQTISEREYLKLGPMNVQQKLVVIVFLMVVGLWLTEGLHGISSSTVALIGGLSLLILRLLDEKDISSEIRWSSLLILGSGIALGNAMIATGVSTYLAFQMAGLGILPSFLIVIIVGVIAVLLTMVASNTGAAVILIPIAIPLATGLGIDPLLVTMMISTGLVMDLIAILVVTIAVVWLWSLLGLVIL
jgi:sodium-dependent dicarboxylate transporter 2/3/5